MEDCYVFKKELAQQLAIERGKRVRVVETAEEAATLDSDSKFPEYNLHVSHIFGDSTSYTSKREYKKIEREVCSMSQGATAKMIWSQHKIKFSKADHPKIATTPGRYPIVVEPTIRNIKVARVLIDGESSINLLFASTLDAMRIPRKFDTAYKAIIGRTTLVKFMAASHYAYQVLKMLGPKGTITIQGNAKLTAQCDKRSLDMVEHTPSPPATIEHPKKMCTNVPTRHSPTTRFRVPTCHHDILERGRDRTLRITPSNQAHHTSDFTPTPRKAAGSPFSCLGESGSRIGRRRAHPNSITPTLAWMRRLEESYTTSPAVAHAGLCWRNFGDYFKKNP
uniref:Retrotransposon protein, putative, Ty3-gypsy subclass n=1 Tax=Oryza sativa subsp. japonica TaxID=39947 RepID=Q2QWP9_ORYSJ|nr:retrotransposon protein, putative, Ty3-gypsy subclass [Oryza sativa Japonica Group]